ncbi:MAG: phenylacetate-CoA oxygenase subunit PaaC [Schleiferiaceae bacterium]|nr:phenylacetate-CoA oxygenase subunit PaaC [Schleiferiaceae bacterium]
MGEVKGGWMTTRELENQTKTTEEARLEYILRLADNALVLGHRLSEWCSNGPVLEQDIAIINTALDQVGLARNYYKLAAEIEGGERDEDYYAYRRDVFEFKNILMLERPNGHWGDTIARQFLYDTFHFFLLEELIKCNDQDIAAIAAKAIKEVAYHAQYSAEWIIRLGDGTEESHNKIQDSLNTIWEWTGEMFETNEVDDLMRAAGIAPDMDEIKTLWHDKVAQVLEIATLEKPEDGWMQTGGKMGVHTQYLGFILAEMQYYPKTYPNAKW